MFNMQILLESKLNAKRAINHNRGLKQAQDSKKLTFKKL